MKVAYHNTFPISQSEAYDIFITNTEYANIVIMSNAIAGVMYGYLIKQKYPNMKFNKDYLIWFIDRPANARVGYV